MQINYKLYTILNFLSMEDNKKPLILRFFLN